MSASAASASEPLARGNRWLIHLRWLAAVGIAAAALVASRVLHYPVPLGALLCLGAVVAGYNALLTVVERRLPPGEPNGTRAAVALANGQIALDLVALGVLTHLAGGVTNPFAVYFVFHMIIASILLSPAAAYAQAAFATAAYAAVVGGEHLGVLQHIPVFGERDPGYSALDAAAHIAVMASAQFITVFLTSAVTQRLREHERDLALALAEVQRQVEVSERVRADLQRTQEMRLRYMRRVSHELRAPLASLGMTLRVIRDGLVGEAPVAQRGLIQRAEARTETMLDLVDDLLTLSRIREAPLQEPEVAVDPGALVTEAAAGLADQAEQKRVRLNAAVEPDLPRVRGQPAALRTMLLNLVGNAIKYTPAGGEVVVAAATDACGGTVILSVRDTGMGIAAEDLPRLFEEFFRTERARQSGIHGTGLGLAIVKLTVDAHAGTINVSSELGRGTTFEVQLPVGGTAQEDSNPA